ncbi:protein RIK isoform X2 [Ananas comosus]|uniref:Protein RIK n=1 Tax=Ananas comosus TaxID=4615 RepID=A0A6P5FAX7_ANACO|nr:protein RIK isoform X2 [Ananas comosus]
MTEDRSPKASDDSAAVAGAAKQRKKRKWDQPAEHFISAAAAVPGLPVGLGGVVGISHPAAVPLPVTDAGSAQLLQSVSIPQNAAEIIQKLTQPKIQDELIAREIVINDADPIVRYKLTKRQTQEEIQKCTGAVVITRGKYRPPNSLPDGEKPLYLHISAGSHLKDMAERIRAVDCAASMVEEILKQVQNSPLASIPLNLVQSNGQVSHPLTTCLFLGFEADPSSNIAARIRGPNDQYINHIIKETGVHVELRGQGSGDLQNCHSEVQQPLHLYLSSTNTKSLEAARILAEHLFDTIAAECGASRIPSSKVYNAVPPPQQLLAGVHGSAMVPPSPVSIAPSTSQCFAPTGVSVSTGYIMPSNVVQPNIVSYAPPSVTGGTRYAGYGGIYPQATPLQQVALALRQAPASTAPAVLSTSLSASTTAKTSSTSAEPDKRPPQKRKFQELLVSPKGPTAPSQVFFLTFSEADRLLFGLVSGLVSQGFSSLGVA